MPAPGVAGPGVVLVKHVQVHEPLAVEQAAVPVDVGVLAVLPLDDGEAVPEVPGVAVPFPVGHGPLCRDVEVEPVPGADWAASLLKIPAPSVTFRIKRASVRQDMEPAAPRVDGGPVLVESEGALMTRLISGLSVGRDVVGPRAVQHRRQSRRVELQHLQEPAPVQGVAVRSDMVCPCRNDAAGPPRLAGNSEMVIGAGHVIPDGLRHMGNSEGRPSAGQLVNELSYRRRFIPARGLSSHRPRMGPYRPSPVGPFPAPWPVPQQFTHAPEFQVPGGPGVRGQVGFRVMEAMHVVDEDVASPCDDGLKPVLALPPNRSDGVLGQRPEPVAARKKEHRVVIVVVQGNAQAVHCFPHRVQPDVLVNPDLGPDSGHLDQHVLPGQDRVRAGDH